MHGGRARCACCHSSGSWCYNGENIDDGTPACGQSSPHALGAWAVPEPRLRRCEPQHRSITRGCIDVHKYPVECLPGRHSLWGDNSTGERMTPKQAG